MHCEVPQFWLKSVTGNTSAQGRGADDDNDDVDDDYDDYDVDDEYGYHCRRKTYRNKLVT